MPRDSAASLVFTASPGTAWQAAEKAFGGDLGRDVPLLSMEKGELNSSLLSPLLTTSEVIYASEVIRKITTAFDLSMGG